MTSLRKRRRRRRRRYYYIRKGAMDMEWIGKMKEAINATYLDEKWRDYFHNIVDRAVERGASERETARKVWLAMNVIHATVPGIRFNTKEKPNGQAQA